MKSAKINDLKYLWNRTRFLVKEKISDIPDVCGYWSGNSIILDNLDHGNYFIKFANGNEDNAERYDFSVSEKGTAKVDVELPDGINMIYIFTASGNPVGRIRVVNLSANSENSSYEEFVKEYAQPKGNYITMADKDDLIQEILLLSGTPIRGIVDDENNIVLNGHIADGTYVLKYENTDGTSVEIGEIVVANGNVSGDSDNQGAGVENLIETARTHTDPNTVFNGIGYMDEKYASSSSPFFGTDANTVCTGLIPATFNSVFYIKGVTLDSNSHCRFGLATTNASTGALAVYTVKVINELSSYLTVETLAENYYKVTFSSDYLMTNCPALQYMWFSAVGVGENLIVATTPIE